MPMEKTEDLKYKNFFRCFLERAGLDKLQASLSDLFGSSALFVLSKEHALDADKISYELRKSAKRRGRLIEKCVNTIKGAVKVVNKKKAAEGFKCSSGTYGFCQPLITEDEIMGYLIIWKLSSRPSRALFSLVGQYAETLTRAVQKEMELNELHRTMKPRAIALSTVHTVHRLITSSFDLDHLLERIARLALQISSANRCSIKLLDSKKKTLLPKATVDLRTKNARLKKVKIGKWAPGRAVKYGKSIMSERYLATPLIDEDVVGVITLYDKVDTQPFNDFDIEIMRTLAEQAAVAIKNAQLYKEQEKITMGSINALAQIIASRGAGVYTTKPVFLKVVQLMGQELKLREYEQKRLQYATLLHDAGELMVPERVLRKKDKLTEKEYKLIKEHPLKGAKIIKSLKSLKSIAPIIMYHHENYDGTGYPKQLKGTEIPIGARILGVVAAFDAMVTKRPYRVPLSIDKATEEIKKNSGKQFDPKVVDAFLRVIKRADVMKRIKKEIYAPE